MGEGHGWGESAGPLTLVRAWSAADRQTTDNSGHQRSGDVCRNRRSLDLQPPDLERRRGVMWSSSLPTVRSRPRGVLSFVSLRDELLGDLGLALQPGQARLLV